MTATTKAPLQSINRPGEKGTWANVGLRFNSLLDEERDEEELFSMLNYQDFTQQNTKSTYSPKRQQEVVSVKRRRVVQQKPRPRPEELRCADILPIEYANMFSFPIFNKMQSEAFADLYNSKQNLVISAPTGSGKTTLFELAIIALLREVTCPSALRVVYTAPTKSLCYEKFNQWNKMFQSLNVKLITGDTENPVQELKCAQIGITTPEKFDSISRNLKAQNEYLHSVSLLLVDEVHTIKDNRGAALEVAIVRLNTLSPNLRIIAVSGTILNPEDLALWLKAKRFEGLPAKALKFNESHRPIKLQTFVHAYSCKSKNSFQLDNLLNQRLTNILSRYSKSKPTLVFCCTRKSVVACAKHLSKRCPIKNSNLRRDFWSDISDKSLHETARNGVGFHHAGLSPKDRLTVEQNFLNGNLNVLCCTSTLAVGINLPAYLVVVKGTSIGGDMEERDYSVMEVLQMIGRAGRPQFEKEGCAVIMTQSGLKERYSNLEYGLECVESVLHMKLAELLCAEVNSGIVYSAESALLWLKNTFFYSRFQKNTVYYKNLQLESLLTSDNIDGKLFEICSDMLAKLSLSGIITKENDKFHGTPFSVSMSQLSLSLKTVERMISLPLGLSLSEIIRFLPQLDEFSTIKMRFNERKLFQEINNMSSIRIPLFFGEDCGVHLTAESKVLLLLQFRLGGSSFPQTIQAASLIPSFYADVARVFDITGRILRGLRQCFVAKRDLVSLKELLILITSVTSRVWADTSDSLTFLKNVHAEESQKLEQAGIPSIVALQKAEPLRIQTALKLSDSSFCVLMSQIKSIPCISICLSSKQVLTRQHGTALEITVEVRIGYKGRRKKGRVSFDVVAFRSSNQLVDYRKIHLGDQRSTESFKIFTAVDEGRSLQVEISCEDIPGLKETTSCPLRLSGGNPGFQSTNNTQVKDSILPFGLGGSNCSKLKVRCYDTTIGTGDSSEDDDILELFARQAPKDTVKAVPERSLRRLSSTSSPTHDNGVKKKVVLTIRKSDSRYGAMLVPRTNHSSERPCSSIAMANTDLNLEELLCSSSEDTQGSQEHEGNDSTGNMTSVIEQMPKGNEKLPYET
ncbi:LANO_0D00496g1_1 [Lachancea nothofagi CBS 11611]|uniref:LANO_0D00496g1_1 n=1 Tax=Lachancea nothofagi CBS 11611 TaxID=1266666 RepID=A0A1G4JCN2_9SACH|nr:LANO_0D00496g1_1 [Lachancea nothofagi CBS 11611]